MDDCKHSAGFVVEDRSVGATICTACGMFLQNYFFDDTPIISSSSDNTALGDFSSSSSRSRTRKVVWHSETQAERTMRLAKRNISNFAAGMRLNETIQGWAFELYSDAMTESEAASTTTTTTTTTTTLKGRSQDLVACSTLYYACKICNVDRTESEIAINCNISLKLLAQTNKIMRRLLGNKPYADRMLSPVKPSALVPRFLEVMMAQPTIIPPGKNNEVRRKAQSLAVKLEDSGRLNGRLPETMCAAVLSYVLIQLLNASTKKDKKAIIVPCAERCGLKAEALTRSMEVVAEIDSNVSS